MGGGWIKWLTFETSVSSLIVMILRGAKDLCGKYLNWGYCCVIFGSIVVSVLHGWGLSHWRRGLNEAKST